MCTSYQIDSANIQLIPFYELNSLNKLLILQWRNNDEVRKWMFTNKIITKDEHLQFIDTLDQNREKKYFLVQLDKEKIGVIYFTYKEKKIWEFGLYLNPDLKGYGSILMETIIKYAKESIQCEKLIAEVFSDNQKAIKLYMKYNFEEKYFCDYSGRKLITMERYL